MFICIAMGVIILMAGEPTRGMRELRLPILSEEEEYEEGGRELK
jgi:hypothetical protein